MLYLLISKTLTVRGAFYRHSETKNVLIIEIPYPMNRYEIGKIIYSGVSQNGHSEKRTNPYNGQTSWHGLNLPSKHVILKQSPKKRTEAMSPTCPLSGDSTVMIYDSVTMH